ncbi:uncharacterized protein LY89DRAFT_465385 [Mollisia scopiformis]|uniref:Uncharacterized protein n=1 Tax=Mollisia scopiformis TaxID=149040 RepID=A0A194XIF6_MOLSC|nr:uncharacterized protein LY89DRAFT_465385 [Mollisia scopiformis]KUJ19909.1 hypothetical protein LY89DRAFT_465385 [Mollisia scopiformis]
MPTKKSETCENIIATDSNLELFAISTWVYLSSHCTCLLVSPQHSSVNSCRISLSKTFENPHVFLSLDIATAVLGAAIVIVSRSHFAKSPTLS